jgi:hypothetical protein
VNVRLTIISHDGCHVREETDIYHKGGKVLRGMQTQGVVLKKTIIKNKYLHTIKNECRKAR